MTCTRSFQSIRTQKSGKTCEQSVHLKISVKAENLKNASEQSDTDENNTGNSLIAPEFNEEKMRTNLELHTLSQSTD